MRAPRIAGFIPCEAVTSSRSWPRRLEDVELDALEDVELDELELPTLTSKELVASPMPPLQISKPASTSMRYPFALM
jgi:hypothetical protein